MHATMEPSAKRLKVGDSSSYCSICKIFYPTISAIGHYRSQKHRDLACREVGENVQLVESCFKTRIASYRVTSEQKHILVVEFMKEIEGKVSNLIREQLEKFNSIKVNVELFAMFENESKEEEQLKSFNTRNEIVTPCTELDHIFEDFTRIIDSDVADFVERGSGKFFIFICL